MYVVLYIVMNHNISILLFKILHPPRMGIYSSHMEHTKDYLIPDLPQLAQTTSWDSTCGSLHNCIDTPAVSNVSDECGEAQLGTASEILVSYYLGCPLQVFFFLFLLQVEKIY